MLEAPGNADTDALPQFESAPISQLLLKVAARCNIDCSYCYWFRDASVYQKPKLMSAEVLSQFLLRLEEHIVRHHLEEFTLILHGGEPLLWGIENFRRIGRECRAISRRSGCPIQLAVTTNGILIDDRWVDCLKTHEISVTISLDGPSHIHDIHRRTFQGRGTHAAVEQAVRLLQAEDVPVNALAVCNPAYHPKEFFDFFAKCGIDKYDIMFPDVTLGDEAPRIAPFYNRLFDLWLEANRHKPTVSVRTIVDIVTALLGGDAMTEGFGYRPVELCTVMTDGSVEPHDVLRIAGDASTTTTFNLFDHAIEDIKQEPRWQAAREASLRLCEKCRQCRYLEVCGGGYLPHRFSPQNGYDNPSVYCDDLYAMYEHMRAAIEAQIYVGKPDGHRIRIDEALAPAAADAPLGPGEAPPLAPAAAAERALAQLPSI